MTTNEPQATNTEEDQTPVLPDSTSNLCPVCLATQLLPSNQCTLRCGHVICHLCLPQLRTPLCPICRRPIWSDGDIHGASTPDVPVPWPLDGAPFLLEPMPSEPPATIPSASTMSTEDDADTDEDIIPVLLLSRPQLRRIFHQ